MNPSQDDIQEDPEDPSFDEKKSRLIFSALARTDVQELKLLLNAPKWYTVEGKYGYNLLQYSIIQEKREVFDFLLSIDDFPLDATGSYKTTAIILSLTRLTILWNYEYDEYYATELIKKGANIHSVDVSGNTLLHLAVKRGCYTSCQLLLDKGVDVNAENNEGKTPFEMLLPLTGYNITKTFEITAMLLYYGADVFPPRDRSWGIHVFDFSLSMNSTNLHFQEMLFHYVVDEYSNSCFEINSDSLFHVMSLFPNCPLVYQIINKMNDVIENDLPGCASNMFLIDNNYMKLLVERFDYLISSLLKCCLNFHHEFDFSSESLANFAILLESHLIDDTIEFVNYVGISGIIKGFNGSDCPYSIMENLIYYILPYLSAVSCEDLNMVYRFFGYSHLFKSLLHMDVIMEDGVYDIMPGMIFDVNLDLATYLDSHIFPIDDPYGDGIPQEEGWETGCSVGGVVKLLDHFAAPMVKNFCYKQNIERLVTKANKLPELPLLQELARESCRKFLVAKYNITTSRQFYTILDRLPISSIHKKIISYETALYHV